MQRRTTTRPAYGIAPAVYRRRWWILAVLCLSLLIVFVGNSSLNVAIPTMARELDATESQLQWVVAAYSLVFAGLLLTSGAFGDRFGRKGILQVGLVIFMVACVAADAFGRDVAAHRLSGPDGRRRGADHAVDAVDPRQRVPARTSARRRSRHGPRSPARPARSARWRAACC